MLFIYLTIGIIVWSFVLSWFDIAFMGPQSGDSVEIQNMLSGEGMIYIFSSMLPCSIIFQKKHEKDLKKQYKGKRIIYIFIALHEEVLPWE
ncbi:AbgT family transporter [Geomicrobium halophilum]|uniref:AbgT family transporter n=1 Tax=Geomicrobium halophilum TaxID=549000 RepID=UPI00160F48C2